MTMSSLIGFRLNVFDAGSAAAASGEAGATDGASAQGEGSEAVNNESSQTTVNVAGENDNAQAVDYNAEFEQAIKKGGKYYEAFQKKADTVAARATSRAKTAEETVAGFKKVLDFVAKTTGADITDSEGLLSALKDINSLFEKYAMRNGCSTAEAKLRIENELLKESEKARLEAVAGEENRKRLEKAAADKMQGWIAEAESVKQKYAQYGLTFDLQKDLANNDFRRLIQSMGSVEDAYRTIHFDEIQEAVVNAAVKRAEENAVNAIKSNRGRPLEGGVSASKSVHAVKDISNLTPKERAQIAKDLMNGKKPFN